jgi:hypothetical protein
MPKISFELVQEGPGRSSPSRGLKPLLRRIRECSGGVHKVGDHVGKPSKGATLNESQARALYRGFNVLVTECDDGHTYEVYPLLGQAGDDNLFAGRWL